MWFNGIIEESYLHPSVLYDSELGVQIKNAEYDIFNHFLEDGEVKLKGYSAEKDEADALLVEAVERTIGEVASYRLRNKDVQSNIQARRQGQRSETYFTAPSWDGWPDGWISRLTPFDNRTQLYMT